MEKAIKYDAIIESSEINNNILIGVKKIKKALSNKKHSKELTFE